jgi:hypothetical protein
MSKDDPARQAPEYSRALSHQRIWLLTKRSALIGHPWLAVTVLTKQLKYPDIL